MKYNFIKKILLALTFFTRLPLGKRNFGSLTLAQSVAAFPIVGAVIGALTGCFYLIIIHAGLHNNIAAWLTIIFSIILPGGLHDAGLAPTAHGLASGRTVEQKLAIMRDSRIGSYGVLALITIISLKANIIAGFNGKWETLPVFIAAAACSRTLLAILLRTTTCARPNGLAQMAGKPTSYQTLLAIFIASLSLLATGKIFAEFFAICALVIIYVIIKQISNKNFGGITGDILGAAQQLSEVALLLVFTIS